MGRGSRLLLWVALVVVACSEDDDAATTVDAGAGGAAGGSAGASSGGTSTGGVNTGGTNTGGASGSSDASLGGNPGVGGGSAGACPTSAPTLGEECTDYGTCCYGPDEIPFYCTPDTNWEPHPSGRSCCPAVEPVDGAECFVVPYLDCCYGPNGYNCDGTTWNASSTNCAG